MFRNSIICCYAVCILLSCVVEHSTAQKNEVDWDRFRLPNHYQGTAEFQYQVDDKLEYWKRVEFSVGESYTFLKTFQDIQGVGQSVVDIRYSNFDESTLILPSSKQAQITDRFAKTYTEAGEADISPIPILRVLHFRSDQIQFEVGAQSNDGTATVRFTDKNGAKKGYSEVDIQDDRIIAYRYGNISGKFVFSIQYQNWIELPSGTHVPTRILSNVWDRPTGYTTRQIINISNVKESQDSTPPQKPSVPAGYTIIDHINGVTRTADGQVIAPIDSTPTHPNPTSTNWKDKLLIAAGVFLVFGAGVIWRIRGRTP